ncbi:helicase RepA family protein [Micromonospora zamorensis]|uniref:AAA family ATPase n=1 Tax=Micromonospora zamorensis TaxID=709883 RepID=UPI003529F551|nr:helicase RepA family protein [Micromonospora zamorensis]
MTDIDNGVLFRHDWSDIPDFADLPAGDYRLPDSVAPPQDQPALDTERLTFTPEAINWPEFLATDPGEADWHAGQLIERGQQMSLIGAGKVGKSLLALDWAVTMAAGHRFLGDEARAPVPVLYLDMENTPVDIKRRIVALGHQAADLANLHYLQFPAIGPLDTRDGAAALLARVDHYAPQVVILDTVSRFISKPENDSNTWLDLYNHSLKHLKRRGITVIRLDHFGKEVERGGRGSSAKTQDVDHVWELTPVGRDTFRLKRTFTRTGLGPTDLTLRRDGRPGEAGTTRHEVIGQASAASEPTWLADAAIASIVTTLDAAGVPARYGREKLRAAGLDLGLNYSTDTWAAVAKARKGQP